MQSNWNSNKRCRGWLWKSAPRHFTPLQLPALQWLSSWRNGATGTGQERSGAGAGAGGRLHRSLLGLRCRASSSSIIGIYDCGIKKEPAEYWLQGYGGLRRLCCLVTRVGVPRIHSPSLLNSPSIVGVPCKYFFLSSLSVCGSIGPVSGRRADLLW